MKNILRTMGFFIVLSAYADIEYSPREESKATHQEIAQNRACFKELEVQGCGDPGNDKKQFRSCLNNVYSSLTDNCKKMMSELYNSK